MVFLSLLLNDISAFLIHLLSLSQHRVQNLLHQTFKFCELMILVFFNKLQDIIQMDLNLLFVGKIVLNGKLTSF